MLWIILLGAIIWNLFFSVTGVKAFRTPVVKQVVFLRTLKQLLKSCLPEARKVNSLSVGHCVK
jgi:hypothetical protein